MTITRAAVGLAAAASALILSACSSDASGTQQDGAGPSATPSAVAANSEAALRETLKRNYTEVAQKRNWAAQWDFNSPRCQKKYDRDYIANALETANADRDFSGPEQYLITVNGDAATVVRKPYDGKGNMQPQTWTFINGAWRFDNC